MQRAQNATIHAGLDPESSEGQLNTKQEYEHFAKEGTIKFCAEHQTTSEEFDKVIKYFAIHSPEFQAHMNQIQATQQQRQQHQENDHGEDP